MYKYVLVVYESFGFRVYYLYISVDLIIYLTLTLTHCVTYLILWYTLTFCSTGFAVGSIEGRVALEYFNELHLKGKPGNHTILQTFIHTYSKNKPTCI